MAARPSIFVTRRWPEPVQARLADSYEVSFNNEDTQLGPGELERAARSFDALCVTVSDRITAEVVVAGAGRLKMIGNFGVGVSHIDLQACRAGGIVVTNTPDVLTDSTADLAIALMLMVARRTGEGERVVRSGTWSGWRPTDLLGTDVSGRTLGLIGFGRIGQATARRAYRAFHMKVMYHSRHRLPVAQELQLNAQYCASIEELLAASDFVSLHCPGGDATRHLIDARRLGAMRRSAFLINTSRGEVVDEAALARAVRSGQIAGAALDVYESEPSIDPALLTLENVVLLPHLGSATRETRSAMGMRVIDNLDRFFAGLEPADRVV